MGNELEATGSFVNYELTVVGLSPPPGYQFSAEENPPAGVTHRETCPPQ
ncbi:hypothetical protein RintRC_5594 [Richelia intracellularis]|nr:hypothetical protein RintRC_5594 [Richelia intracellularis]